MLTSSTMTCACARRLSFGWQMFCLHLLVIHLLLKPQVWGPTRELGLLEQYHTQWQQRQ
jgi:hypothetical protein